MPRLNDEFISDGGGGFRPVGAGYGTHYWNGTKIVEKKKRRGRRADIDPRAAELLEEERQQKERQMWDAYMEKRDYEYESEE